MTHFTDNYTEKEWRNWVRTQINFLLVGIFFLLVGIFTFVIAFCIVTNNRFDKIENQSTTTTTTTTVTLPMPLPITEDPSYWDPSTYCKTIGPDPWCEAHGY